MIFSASVAPTDRPRTRELDPLFRLLMRLNDEQYARTPPAYGYRRISHPFNTTAIKDADLA